MILGVDPGLGGGLALLAPDGGIRGLWDMPTFATGKGAQRQYDLRACWGLVASIGGTGALELIAVERLQVTPKITKHTALGLGRAAMLWEAFAVALEVPLERIAPKRWQAAVGAEKGERAAIARARELFPAAEITLAKHSGRAAALLIAECARRQLVGGRRIPDTATPGDVSSPTLQEGSP